MAGMIFVIDVGNTNVVMGIFKGEKLVKDWRIRTERNVTEDEFSVLLKGLFSGSGISFDVVEKTVISSVVPPMLKVLETFCRKYLGRPPLWVDAKTAAGMPILYNNPSEVGADRIVNAVGAFYKYKTSLIVIDFGTATTFDAISANGEYLGGAISPGVMIAAEALYKETSKLPRVEIFAPPKAVIGKDTENSIKSGIIFGYAGLVDGMVRRMAAEMKTTPKVIATGGLAMLMGDVAETIEAIEPDLTLRGLRIISESI
jgi:type III pantothenate kinase